MNPSGLSLPSVVAETAAVVRSAFAASLLVGGVPLFVAWLLMRFLPEQPDGFLPLVLMSAVLVLYSASAAAATLVAQAWAAGVTVPPVPGLLFTMKRFWLYVAASWLWMAMTAAAFAAALFVALVALTAVSWVFVTEENVEAVSTALGLGAALFSLAAGAWVFMRTSLAVSAHAAGEELTVRGSWKATQGHGTRMVAALALCTLPVAALSWVAAAARSSLGQGLAFEIAAATVVFVTVFQVTVTGALTGVWYRRLGPSTASGA